MVSPEGSIENKEQETVQFVSEQTGDIVNIESSIPPIVSHDSIDKMYLAKFLERPVLINSYKWLETDTVGVTTWSDPFYEFFNNPIIKNKLHNFAFLSCTLKVKIVINASPFYYGAALINYNPSPKTHIDVPLSTADEWFVALTQRPHLYLLPQDNAGGELTLPFIYHKNYIDIATAQDFHDLGRLTHSVQVPLISANGVTGTGVTVSWFAWAENVTVTGSSLSVALSQADDEYDGTISGPSRMVGNACDYLSQIPIIGRVMSVGSVVAHGISKIAHIFGFTVVPNLNAIESIRVRPFPNTAATSGMYPIDRLSLDPKRELGITQNITGAPDTDPLLIDNIITRESFLRAIPWSTSDLPDTILFYTPISPTLCRKDSATYPRIYSTPMSYIAALFNNWRGDIILRFQIICSKFHKGRLRISWDPAGTSATNLCNTPSSYAGVYTSVIDLGVNDNVEFRIPYLQATHWQNCNYFGDDPSTISHSPTYNVDRQAHNGCLTIRVVTQLTAPIASADIQILCFIRSANVEFANPSFWASKAMRFSPLPAQAGDEYNQIADVIVQKAGPDTTTSENTYLVCMGEKVVSLRQLLHRFVLTRSIVPNTTISGIFNVNLEQFIYPHTFGYAAAGGFTLQNAKSRITPANTVPFSWNPLNATTWLMPCYVGVRGSYNYITDSAHLADSRPIRSMVSRDSAFSSVTSTLRYIVASASTMKGSGSNAWRTGYNNPTSGTVVMNAQSNTGQVVEIPDYNAFNYHSTDPGNANHRNTFENSDRNGWFTSLMGYSSAAEYILLDQYGAAGMDFNFIFFLNAPAIYDYGGIPSSAVDSTPGNFDPYIT